MGRAAWSARNSPRRSRFKREWFGDPPERRTWRIAPADAPEKTVTVRHRTLTGALQEARDRHFGEGVRLVAEEVF